MINIRIASTTPVAGIQTRLLAALGIVLATYYKYPVLSFLLALYLAYLLWSYSWTAISCRHSEAGYVVKPERIFCGESFYFNFKFLNQWIFPLVRCGVTFKLPELFQGGQREATGHIVGPLDGDTNIPPDGLRPGWRQHIINYAWLPGSREMVTDLSFTALLRGVYYLPPPEFFGGDPSGLFRGRFQTGKGRYLTVYPQVKDAGDLLEVLVPEETRRDSRYGLEDRYQLQGVRDYQCSDPPKSINWYATARTGSLKSNLYLRKASERCLVVFDLSTNIQPVYNTCSKRFLNPPLEEAISIAVSIALYYLRKGAMTAFFTNAPLLHWEKEPSTLAKKGSAGFYLKRMRGITTTKFDVGNRHAREFLELSTAIDESSRAYPAEQKKLWLKLREVSSNTVIYIIGFHDPPQEWLSEGNAHQNQNQPDPGSFYTSQRLASLSSPCVRRLNLSGGELAQ